MSGERSVIRASEFCSSVRDGTHDSPKSEPYGHKLITSRHLKNGRIHQHEAYAISDDDYAAINKRSKVDKWDVLISMIGTIGEVCLVKEEPEFAIKNVGLFKTKSENDGKWLYYYLLTRDAQNRIAELSRGTTQQYLPLNALRDLPILCCDSLSEQSVVVSILSTLDDKIELNRKMNETLEQMARALFKGWFVDFDPIRAKMEGRTPTGMDAATAALFPDRLVDSELGPIPEGWEVAHIGDVVEVFDSKRIPLSGREREQRQGPYPYHGAASVMDYVDDYLFDGVYALMGEDGSVITDDGMPVMQYVWGKFWVNNHAHVLRGKNGVSTEHVLLHLQGSNIAAFVTGAVQLKLSQGNMNRIPFLLPTRDVSEAFARTIDPLFTQIRANKDQSRTLSTLRDTLLPKLVSGEVRV